MLKHHPPSICRARLSAALGFGSGAAVALVLLAASAFAGGVRGAADGGPVLELRARSREGGGPADGRTRIRETLLRWPARKTAIVICDMWDRHWCKGATRRVAEMAPRMNRVVAAARRMGVFVIHAPSDCMEAYEGTPQRRRAQQAPQAPDAPEEIGNWCTKLGDEPPLPIDDSDGGCDCEPRCKNYRAWSREIETLEIAPEDAVSDSGREIWNLLSARGIDNVIVMGVHTNMCVLGRPFGLRRLVQGGKNVVLARDLTDSMYNPRRPPYVSHRRGTELVVAHIERYVCPTILSGDIAGEPEAPLAVFVIGEREYRTAETLPRFAREELEPRGIRTRFIFARGDDPNAFDGLEALEEAELLVLSVRRRTPSEEAMRRIRSYLESGRPLVGIRTASHAFDREPPPGHVRWAEFDREVLGHHYEGHYGSRGPHPRIRIREGAAGHPILDGVPPEFQAASHLYKVRDVSPQAEVLLEGTRPDGKGTEPTALTHTYKGGRIFYTSLGAPGDFESAAFRRLLANACFWALEREPPPAAAGGGGGLEAAPVSGAAREGEDQVVPARSREEPEAGRGPQARAPAPAGGAGAPRRTGAERPNVVLVMTDDQGYGDLACHGNPEIRTPNLDRLHAQSIRLTQFHVDPTCSPTRAALLTGRYSARTGVWHTIMGRSLLREDEVTMADVFARAGYRTGIFGKWHLGDNYPLRPQDRGFHEVLVHGGGGVGQTPDYWGNDYFDDTYFHNGVPERFEGYCTEVFFRGALRFVEENRSRPFFLYLPTNVAHGPYHVPEEAARPYREKGIPEPRASFYGMITDFDRWLGKLLERLEELDLERRTIVVFLTDNGTAAGYRAGRRDGGGFNAGMRGTKGSEYDGGHRVPCFIRWPGRLEGGRDIGRLAAHIDLMPTLLDLCGLEPPPGVKFDGRSLVPLLEGEGAWPERTLFVQSHRIEHPRPWRKSAVLTERYRLVNGTELYDIVADPGQKRDIAREKPEIVAELRRAYERWYEDVSARFDEYVAIGIGSDKENPARLTCHDWHGKVVPWHQNMVRRAPYANGFWAVRVERAGRYRFTLMRQPREEPCPLEAVRAEIRIGGVEAQKEVKPDSEAVSFELELPAGETRLETRLITREGKERGAFFVYVKRL